MNFFSETLANIGKRLNGTQAGCFLIVGPGWNGDTPDGMEIIRSNTNVLLAFMRILVNNEADLPEVRPLQNKFRITSLSSWKKGVDDAHPLALEGWPEYKNSNGIEFFQSLNQLLKLNPIPEAETGLLAGFASIGVGPEGKGTVLQAIPGEVFDQGIETAKMIIAAKGMQFGEDKNFWKIARTGIGRYGYDYLQRAVVWFKGALANVPEDSPYPSTYQDSQGKLLDGRDRYILVFAKDQQPPVSQFWSVTIYKFGDALLVDNPINRYSIGNRTPDLRYGEDGSLTIYIQHDTPGYDKECNWLPAPDEKFYLTLRLYGPSQEVLEGQWAPPSVQKL